MPDDLTLGDGRRLRRLDPMSLTELSYQSIRASIVSGRFVAGERLVETRLARELGVSRAPVREALKRLVEERLVVEQPRYGTFVREFTARDFVDIYNVRVAIETTAVRLMLRRKAPTKPLEHLVDEMVREVANENREGVVDAELRFHEELCGASSNSYLLSIFRSLSGQIQLALSLDDAAYADLASVASEHVPVIDAIRSGNEFEAVRTLHSHIISSAGKVLERLSGETSALLGPWEPESRSCGTLAHQPAV